MSRDSTLPIELYLPILEYISDLSSLAKLCLVDQGFLELARRKLYKHIWIRPWEDSPDTKFNGIFQTISTCPEIAALVERLDVIYYPLASTSDWALTCDQAFENLTSLTSLSWTRDKSMTSKMLGTLSKLEHLTRLELNGRSWSTYDPTLLTGMKHLKEIKLHTPDREMMMAMEGIVTSLAKRGKGQGLESFEIITRTSNFINDRLMQRLSTWLSDLKVFKLFGCGHVGPRGYFAVLRAAGPRLEELGLEGVGVGDDEDQLDEDLYLERESPLSQGIRLSNLKRLFLSETAFSRLLLPDYSRQEQMYVERAVSQHGEYGLDLASIEREDTLPQLSNSSFLPPKLESLLLSRERDSLAYRAGAPTAPRFEAVAQLWPNSLKRLWMSHFIVDFGDLRKIGELLPRLESLMIRLPQTKCPPQWIARFIGRFPELKRFHVQIAPETQSTTLNETLFSLEDMELIARSAGPRLEQIGFFNQVFLIRRDFTESAEVIEERPRGWTQIDPPEDAAEPRTIQIHAVEEKIVLEAWQKGGLIVPEIFQVWRV